MLECTQKDWNAHLRISIEMPAQASRLSDFPPSGRVCLKAQARSAGGYAAKGLGQTPTGV